MDRHRDCRLGGAVLPPLGEIVERIDGGEVLADQDRMGSGSIDDEPKAFGQEFTYFRERTEP